MPIPVVALQDPWHWRVIRNDHIETGGELRGEFESINQWLESLTNASVQIISIPIFPRILSDHTLVHGELGWRKIGREILF